LFFGQTGGESHIRYREELAADHKYLVISGSAKGMVLSGSSIVFDGSLVGTSQLDISPDGANVSGLLQVRAGSNSVTGAVMIENHATAADKAPSLDFRRSHGETRTTPAAVVENDALGTISWHAHDSVDYASGFANIKALVDGTVTENNSPGRLTFETGPTDDDRPVERMIIDSAGNVGIGTASPGTILEIKESDALIRLRTGNNDQGNLGIDFAHRDSDTLVKTAIISNALGAYGRSDLHFIVDTVNDSNAYTWGTDTKMLISGDTGNVGIGTDDPLHTLSVTGTMGVSDALYLGAGDDLGDAYIKYNTADTYMTVSGSTKGLALSGSHVVVTSPLVEVNWDPDTPATGTGPVLRLTSNDSVVDASTTLGTIEFYGEDAITNDSGTGAKIVAKATDAWTEGSDYDRPTELQFWTANDGVATTSGLSQRVTMGQKAGLGFVLDVSGSTIFGALEHGTMSESTHQFSGSIYVLDGKKLVFGSADSANHIQYNTAGTTDGYLVVSGSATGLVLSGSNIILDAESAALGVAASAGSKLHIEHTDTTTWATDGATNNVNYDDFLLTLRNNTDTQHAFAGIAFDVTSETDPNSIGAGILAVADNATSTAHDTNLIFATNDAGDAALRERMRITHDGSVGIGEFAGPEYKLDVRSDDTVPGKEQAQLGLSTYADTSTYESALVFRRARGSIGGPTVVADGDALGSIKWEGYNDDSPAGFEFGARIAVEVDGTPSSSDASDMPAKMVFGVASDGSSAATTRLTIDSTGLATFTGNVYPSDNNTQDLGGINNRWANLYTGDLHLKNERGDWTIVEEEDYLCVVNNKSGKKYKMMLQEIED
jgi:hypothetical protein